MFVIVMIHLVGNVGVKVRVLERKELMCCKFPLYVPYKYHVSQYLLCG